MSATVVLREMQPEDSPALARLVASALLVQDGFGLTTRFLVEPYRAWTLLRPNMKGVVAEVVGTKKIVGMATVAFDTYAIEGQAYDVAFLGNLKVHHDYRQQGLGTRLAEWRIAAAQERCGPDVVILSATTSDNAASLSTMKKWNAQFFAPLRVVPSMTTPTMPEVVPNLMVRPLLENDLPGVVSKAEAFYESYGLFPLYSPQLLRSLLHTTPQVYHYRVAVDIAGNLLAGVLISNRAALMVDEFRSQRSIPSLFEGDNALRTAELATFWYTDLAAARYLWQHIRWEFNAHANNIAIVFDPCSGLRDVFQIEDDHTPQFELIASISGSIPFDTSKPVSLGVRS